jgi:hypothetical protein
MLFTSSNLFMRPSYRYDSIDAKTEAILSSNQVALHTTALGVQQYEPYHMPRKLIYKQDRPDGIKCAFVQLFTISMFVYEGEWGS